MFDLDFQQLFVTCLSKVAYPDYNDALVALNFWKEANPQFIYPCPYCDSFHLTKQETHRKKRSNKRDFWRRWDQWCKKLIPVENFELAQKLNDPELWED